MLIVRRSNCISAASGIVTPFLTCVLNSHLKRVTIPDAVLIKFDLLRMSIIVIETCRGMY